MTGTDAPALQLDVVAGYAQVLDLTSAMLEAARKADWDRLVQLEIDRGRLIDQLRTLDHGQTHSPEESARKREFIETILGRDEEIKLLTHDWMHELRDILGSATAQRLLNRTYGSES